MDKCIQKFWIKEIKSKSLFSSFKNKVCISNFSNYWTNCYHKTKSEVKIYCRFLDNLEREIAFSTANI